MNTEPQANSAVPIKKADTNPFGISTYKPRRKFLRRLIVIGAILITACVLVVIFRLLPLKSKINNQLSAQLRVSEITALETVARQEQKSLLDVFNALSQKSGINSDGWDFSDPTAEQLRIIQELPAAADELRTAYLAKRNDYIFLKQSIRNLEAQLGTPRLVRPGDTHFKMAYDFLISQTGRSDEEVRRILQQTRLREPLLPGFKVWNFWLENSFSTFVTQGDAPLTPEEAARQALEKQRLEKEQALASLNSMFFIVGTLQDLQARQILIGGFLKSTQIGEVQIAAFRQAIDLRNQRDIRIQAKDLKLKKISRIAVFPKEFRLGIDYSLLTNPRGRWAVITIRNTQAFRGRRLVIAVE